MFAKMSTKANIWLCILFQHFVGYPSHYQLLCKFVIALIFVYCCSYCKIEIAQYCVNDLRPAYYAHREKKVEAITKEEEEDEKWEDEVFSLGAREEGGEFKLDQSENIQGVRDEEDNAKQEKTSAYMWKLVSFMSVALQFLGLVFTYFSILYGPISIYAIVFTASYLLSGMLVMSYILGIEEKPDKDTRVGNYLIVVAAILVVANGPISSNKEFTPAELEELFFEKQSVIFLSACMILLLVMFPHHFIVMFSKKGADAFSDNVNFIMFQISLNLLALFNTITLKVVPNSKGWFFGLNLAIFIFISVYYPVTSLIQNVVIKNPGVFLSISSAVTYLVNVASGLLVWKDEVRNWTGYSCSIVIFLFGIYLITETDIIKGMSQRWKDMTSTENSLVKSLVVSANANANGIKKSTMFEEIKFGRMSIIPTLNTNYRELE